MKSVLIRCGAAEGARETNVTGCYPPLGLAYLAAALRQAGHAVELLDAEVLGLGPEALLERIPADAALIGFTATTLAWPGVRLAAARVRDRFPGALLVVGGPQVTAFPEETLAASVFDVGVLGDGEQTLVALADRRAAGRPLDDVPGCVVRANGEVRLTGPVAWIRDLDTLPRPALDLLPLARYRSFFVEEPFVTLVASRGCPYRCAFCTQIYSGGSLRVRRAEAVVDEMADAVSRYGARELVLFDETFGANRRLALEVCRLIRARGLRVRWNARTRIDLVDRELMAALREAGCHTVHLGIESGSARILREMNKGLTPEKIRAAVAVARQSGLRTHAYFMIGYPGETRREIADTLRFSRSLGLDWASYTLTIPNPRTPLCDAAVRDGRLRPDYWHDHTFGRAPADCLYFTSPECPAAFLRRAKRLAYLRFYGRPGVLVRNLTFVLRHGGLRRVGYAATLWLREQLT